MACRVPPSTGQVSWCNMRDMRNRIAVGHFNIDSEQWKDDDAMFSDFGHISYNLYYVKFVPT